MIKELTEKWKNGTLETGYYYFKTSTGLFVGFHLKGFKYPYTWRGSTMDDVSKVLAPVSDYSQFVELTEKVEKLEKENSELLEKNEELKKRLESETLAKQEGIELVAELEQKVHILNEANMNLENTVGKFGEQLKEANEVIENMKLCMDDKYDYDCVAEDVDIYLKKWGVK